MESAFYLASRSPRRRELLGQLGLHPTVDAADVDEVRESGQSPQDYALTTALKKARAVAARRPGALVLGADTDVVLDDEILGKPRDRDHAVATLQRLAGRTHQVISAVAVVQDAREATCLTVTAVEFGPIRVEQALAYWETGEPADKAGGYAIQGLAARFVRRIDGSYSGVVGLPLFETAELLAEFGVEAQP